MNDKSPLTVSSTTFKTNKAITYGGIAYYKDSVTPAGTHSVSFKFSTFDTTTSGSLGGAFYIDSSQITSITMH